MELNQHSLSAAFPAMQESEYKSLLDSIESIGLQNPIVLFEGQIIDGWHRYLACKDSGTAIKTIELSETADPQSFVIAQNKERRHLTQSQLATAAIKVYAWHSNALQANRQYTAQDAEHALYADLIPIKTAKEMAEIAGVSTRTIEQAKKIETQATPEIKEKVASGEISVSTAIKQMQPQKIDDNAPPIYTEIDQLKDENSELKDLIEDLNYQISIKNYEGAEPIEAIVKELRMTKANLKQVTISRNGYINELNSAKKQIMAQRKEIDRLKK